MSTILEYPKKTIMSIYNQAIRPEEAMENQNSNTVNVVDIKMPFWSMVVFMVKAAIASIPAIIILTIIGTLVFSVLGGVIQGVGRF